MGNYTALLKATILLLVFASVPGDAASANCTETHNWNYPYSARLLCQNFDGSLDDIPSQAEEFLKDPRNSKTVFLEVRFSRIPILKPSGKVPFENLLRADITDSQIAAIEPGTFENATRLLVLNLNYNRLGELPSGVLSPLRRLIHLSLSNNLIERIAEDAFLGLEWLQEVILDGNRLVELPEDLLRFQHNLQSLDVSRNALKSMKLVKKLCKEVKDLSSLNLNHNALTKYHQDLSKCTIRYFDISSNLLSDVDFALFPRHMDDLDLSNNQITTFSNLHKIGVRKLNLSHNKLTELGPIAVLEDGLSCIENLDLSHNSIHKISPVFFKRLGRPRWYSNSGRYDLSFLNLSYNQIEELSTNFFPEAGGELSSLDVSYNRLEVVDQWLNKSVQNFVYGNNPAVGRNGTGSEQVSAN